MKKLFWLCLALCLALPAAAQREYGLRFSSLINDELTLENAIRLGLENNSDFLAAQQEIIIAEQKVKEAKFLFLPQFSLQGTATWYDLDYPMVLPDSVANRFIPNNDLLSEDMKHQFLGAGISATQYLYAGGRFRNTLKMAEANLKQVQSKYEAVKNATVLNIKKSFFRLLYAQHNVELAEKVQQKAGRYSRSLHTGAWNKIKAQYLLSRLTSLKSEADNELQKAQLAMLVSLNKELNSQIKVRGDFKPVEVELDLPRLNLWAMEFRPELKAAIYALELDNLAIDLALSRRYPDLILTGSYERLGFDNLGPAQSRTKTKYAAPRRHRGLYPRAGCRELRRPGFLAGRSHQPPANLAGRAETAVTGRTRRRAGPDRPGSAGRVLPNRPQLLRSHPPKPDGQSRPGMGHRPGFITESV